LERYAQASQIGGRVMANTILQKILDHPDRDEIVGKLAINISPQDVSEWLSGKYIAAGDKKYLLTAKNLQSFKDNHLDVYQVIKNDFAKTKVAITQGTEDQLQLAIQNNPTYKQMVIDTVSKEMDVKATIKHFATAIETRFAQIFDIVQEDPRNINTKVERVMIEYADVFKGVLELCYKILNEGPDQVIQHNITVQHIDQHITFFYEAIKKVLSQIDHESSMYFMELFNEEIAKAQDPALRTIQPVEERLAQVKVINETINEKINGVP
jgi:hypothetical protein